VRMAWVACILTGQSSLASELELLAVRARKFSVVRRLVWLGGLRGHAISRWNESLAVIARDKVFVITLPVSCR
jgi:hypothetical protein